MKDSRAKKKLIFIGNIPAPYMVRWLEALREFYEVQGWFYEAASGKRDAFWDVPPAPFWKILEGVAGKKNGRYRTTTHLHMLEQERPDIVVLGGFPIPANWMAYRKAKKLGARVCVLSESFRNAHDRLTMSPPARKLITLAYRRLDAALGLTPEAYRQLRSWPEFRGRVHQARYPSDLDDYLAHPLNRILRPATLLFANRLTEGYNPIAALDILALVARDFPDVRLLLNGSGPLRAACEAHAASLGITQSMAFLDNLKSWTDLDAVYRRSDILLLPAKHSAGNFTIYEAMASGMGLVISEEIQGNGRAVESGQNGFRLPHNDIPAMAAAVCRYILAPAILRRHAAMNRARVAELGAAGTARFYHHLFQSIFPELA